VRHIFINIYDIKPFGKPFQRLLAGKYHVEAHASIKHSQRPLNVSLGTVFPVGKFFFRGQKDTTPSVFTAFAYQTL
jgi:hypothetical protein